MIDFNLMSHGQSMFGPGGKPLVTFDKTIFKEGLSKRTYTAYENQPNPAWTAWNSARPKVVTNCDGVTGFPAISCNAKRAAEISARTSYDFADPMQYILTNGETSADFVTSLTIAIDEELRIVHPKTPDLNVVPV